jgi:hypothetical protein
MHRFGTLVVAVCCGLLTCSAWCADDPAPADETPAAQRNQLEDPATIGPQDANPQIRGPRDLWKQKHLVWDYKRTNPRADKILAALEEPTSFEFVDAPLQDVVQFLHDVHGIPIQIDVAALIDVAIDANTPVTKHLRDTSLRSGLELILRDLELDFLIDKEVLLITTAERAANTMETRVYDTRLISSLTSEQVAELISAMIAPQSWKDSTGTACLRSIPGGLVVRQSQRVHGEIIELLRQLHGHQENPLYSSGQEDQARPPLKEAQQ